jgi:two-component system, NarL family, response regulator DesR
VDAGQQVRILVVDGRDAVRDGLMRLLALDSDFDVVAGVASAGMLEPAICSRTVDVVLLAHELPGGAVALIEALRGVWPAVRFVLLCGPTAAPASGAALSGGRGVVLDKDAGIAALATAIRQISDAQAEKTPAGGPGRAPSAATALTARERELLLMIAAGSSNARIAALTGLSPHTVRAHLRSIARKLGVRNRAHAVTAALQSGQIVLDRAS